MRTKGELMAHLVAWRQTHGWGKACDAIGRNEFERRTGLDRSTTRKGLDFMEEQGVVLVESTTQLIPGGELSLRRRYTWLLNERVQKVLSTPATEPTEAEGVGEKTTHPQGERTTHRGVNNSPTRGGENNPLNLVPINQVPVNPVNGNQVKAKKADIQPTKCKNGISPAVSVSFATQPQNKEPAFRGDWTDDDLEAVQNFIEDHEPDDTDDHGRGEWAAEATLNAGMGADAAAVVSFLESMVESGWTAPNYRAFPAVVHHEFERRRNKAAGVQWSDSDLARLRVGLTKFMEGDAPPTKFEHSCELRANGASAQEVFDLLERKWADPKYRPGGKHGPRKWAWFFKVIGNEFSELERSHLPEQPAALPEHGQCGPMAGLSLEEQQVQEEYNRRAMEVLQ
jgi:hypothetical protein